MQIINGIELAWQLKQDISKTVTKILGKHNFKPSIATIVVGDDPASLIYVNRKYQEAIKIDIITQIVKVDADISEEELIQKIELLNNDNTVHAILLQLPLPKHLNTFKIINSIDVNKDVDGLTIKNAGNIAVGNINNTSLIPCTPQGCIALCKTVIDSFVGKNILIIGKSNLVGKPLAILLLQIGCTVTVASKSTLNLKQHSKQADIIFIATGVPNLINGKMIKKNTTIIDIGISKKDNKIIGDCDFESCKNIASFITPVPGGVGPMTIAYLLYNTIICAARQNNKIMPEIKALTKKWSLQNS